MKINQQDLNPIVAYSSITVVFVISLIAICYFYNQQADVLNDSMNIKTERINNVKPITPEISNDESEKIPKSD